MCIRDRYMGKNSPIERSSKMRVSQFQRVIETKRKAGRDPRFDELSGNLKPESFYKAYAFLDEQKEKEITQLQKELNKKKKRLDQEEISYIKEQIGSIKTDLKKKSGLNREFDIKRELKQKTKNQFHLKKGVVKDKVLEKQFEELDKSGKLNKFLQQKKKQQGRVMLHRSKKLVNDKGRDI
eukprot:TRINITY_DN9018_c0_g1_i1.p1 TRINITY_DN9018_c0_g1~~TRINITY_DN9018_c0_g1_i1.p1  ORF type:complete len:181 (-),score=46.38 TRINITY_DN9018_c0_g1_i1:46-588(-)